MHQRCCSFYWFFVYSIRCTLPSSCIYWCSRYCSVRFVLLFYVKLCTFSCLLVSILCDSVFMLEDLLAALYRDDSASHGFLFGPRGVHPSRTEKKRCNATAQQAQKRESNDALLLRKRQTKNTSQWLQNFPPLAKQRCLTPETEFVFLNLSQHVQSCCSAVPPSKENNNKQACNVVLLTQKKRVQKTTL